MEMKMIINEPLSDFSFDDLENEIEIEKDTGCISLDSEIIDVEYNFSIKQNYGRLSNRKKAPSFALVDWRGNLRYDLRCWKDNGNPSRGIAFTREECLELYNALREFEFGAIYDEPIRQIKTEHSVATFFYLIAKLSTASYKNGTWQKEVNLIDWGCGVRVDFRKWTPNYQQHSKGIRINLDELKVLKTIIETII